VDKAKEEGDEAAEAAAQAQLDTVDAGDTLVLEGLDLRPRGYGREDARILSLQEVEMIKDDMQVQKEQEAWRPQHGRGAGGGAGRGRRRAAAWGAYG
jgi:hypothetical protein